MHNSFDDKLVIAGDVEDGAAGSWIGQLNQWLIAQGVLAKTQADQRTLNPIESSPIGCKTFTNYLVFYRLCFDKNIFLLGVVPC